jgi:hypothetical protein
MSRGVCGFDFRQKNIPSPPPLSARGQDTDFFAEVKHRTLDFRSFFENFLWSRFTAI